MRGALHRLDSELKLLSTFSHRWLLGRFVITTMCAGQTPIWHAISGCSSTLRAFKVHHWLVRGALLWRWCEDLDALQPRWHRYVILERRGFRHIYLLGLDYNGKP